MYSACGGVALRKPVVFSAAKRVNIRSSGRIRTNNKSNLKPKSRIIFNETYSLRLVNACDGVTDRAAAGLGSPPRSSKCSHHHYTVFCYYHICTFVFLLLQLHDCCAVQMNDCSARCNIVSSETVRKGFVSQNRREDGFFRLNNGTSHKMEQFRVGQNSWVSVHPEICKGDTYRLRSTSSPYLP